MKAHLSWLWRGHRFQMESLGQRHTGLGEGRDLEIGGRGRALQALCKAPGVGATVCMGGPARDLATKAGSQHCPSQADRV